MTKYYSSLSLLLFTIFFNVFNFGFTQELDIQSKSEYIEILKDSSYKQTKTVIFKPSKERRVYPIFYDTELEWISNIKLYQKKGSRYKEIKKLRIVEEDVKSEYIISKKIKSIAIPSDGEIKLEYDVRCRELMYFTNLPFFSYDNVDTMTYTIKIPKEFDFEYDTIDKDSLDFFQLDSIKSTEAYNWRIKVIPKKVEPDFLQFFGIYRNMKVPLMRMLVIPNTYNRNSAKYLNDWYINNIASTKVLSENAKKKIDELTQDLEDPKAIIRTIYNYVKSNFKYVAIEIGMGAFIPSHVKEVYENKQGDCKDLSNFLTEALKYKGIETHLALAATFDHISDCDFPSLSSANHVICVAYVDDKPILMDPTDTIHIEGTPVQSLQDRTILIVNNEGGSFFKVAPNSPEENQIKYEAELNLNSEKSEIDGLFTIAYNGSSSNYFKRVLQSEGKEKLQSYSKTLFEEIFGNQTISDLKVEPVDENYYVNGNLNIQGRTFNDGQNKFLFLDFLPRLIESENRKTLIIGTYLRNPYQKTVYLKIQLDELIEDFDIIKHSFNEKGVKLDLSIDAISENELEIKYDFTINHIFIDKHNLESTNKILTDFNNIINEPIILKKQKS
ncbi:MAG: transglutaminase-like domain-containing protein [bacterium]